MLRFFYTLILLIISSQLHGQKWYNDPKSHPGVILTNEKLLYKGDIIYNQSEEFLFCKTKTGQKKFTASEVLYFQFYDSQEGINRYFYPYVINQNEIRFFELFLHGEINIYGKSFLISEYIEQKQNVTIFNLEGVVSYRLYYETDGIITEIEEFNIEILPLMREKIAIVSNYIIQEKLNLREYKDQLILVDYYNSMF